jgi:hypothetical protein
MGDRGILNSRHEMRNSKQARMSKKNDLNKIVLNFNIWIWDLFRLPAQSPALRDEGRRIP